MKTLVLSMISIAATVAAMTACTSESDPIDEINPKDGKVEIKLNAGVGAITTKASEVEQFTDAKVTLLRQDVDNSTGTTDWGNTATQYDYTLTGTNIPLDATQKYFNNDVSKKSIFIGYYPTTGATRSNDKVTYVITGEEDLMCTQELNTGIKTSPELNPKLTFKHLLSQIELKIAGTTKADDVFGTINSISLSMPTNVEVSLKSTTATKGSGATDQAIELFNNTTSKKISDLATESETNTLASKFVLAGYGTSSNVLTIKIKVTKNSVESEKTVVIKDITTTVDSTPVAGLIVGRKHIITLTFNDNITITSEIEAITSGGDANGEITD